MTPITFLSTSIIYMSIFLTYRRWKNSPIKFYDDETNEKRSISQILLIHLAKHGTLIKIQRKKAYSGTPPGHWKIVCKILN